jgi:hypothetical protein
MRIFLSYGHDQNTPIALRIKRDLEDAGHTVWIDTAEIKTGDDWRRSIVDGISTSDWTLGLLSRHSVRNPGVCLDELGIALHVKGGTIATVLLEAESEVTPPVSVSHIQWLDMHDWATRLADSSGEGKKWYRGKIEEIIALLANPATERFAGEIEKLEQVLRPISQQADIGALVDGFVGREWLAAKLDQWRISNRNSRLFWISGAPGTGKSAFAAWLAHLGKVNVIAFNLCRYNIDERRDSARVFRTIAFQIATRLPDYRRLLVDRLNTQDPDGKEMDRKSAAALFDWLLSEPLRLGIDGGRRTERYIIVIDALDETIRNGRSELAEILAECCQKLPEWIAVVVTSRPEPAILRQFADYKPEIISAESDENLNDLRTFSSQWLGLEARGASETDPRVERLVEASGGNFLYLRKLQEAVVNGFVDLGHLEGLPQGLVGLYERWFHRQFADPAAYEAFVPLLEVLAAAEHPVPEIWLRRIFGWSEREKARMLEGLGSLFERRKDGVAPFHKSVRDWLVSDRTASAEFVVDVATGVERLVAALNEEFERWTSASGDVPLDPFCEAELMSQLNGSRSDPTKFRDLVLRLGDADVISRKALMNTDYDENARMAAQHRYTNLIQLIAKARPEKVDDAVLWSLVRALFACAWKFVSDTYGPGGVVLSEDLPEHPRLQSQVPEIYRRFREWTEGIYLLVTAVRVARMVVYLRPNSIPQLGSVMDSRLMRFIVTGADGLINEVFASSQGREYKPQRNWSFVCSEVAAGYDSWRKDPRASLSDDWEKAVKGWGHG